MSFIFVHEVIAHPVCAYKIISIRMGDIDVYTVFVPYFLKAKIEKQSLTGGVAKTRLEVKRFGSN